MTLSNETIALFKKASLTYRAINHKLRQQLLAYIGKMQRCTVTEIFIHFRMEQSVASQHLAKLRQAGFVKTERAGKRIYYSVNPEKMKDLLEVSKKIVG